MLARTRVGFGGSPERIFVFATPANFPKEHCNRRRQSELHIAQAVFYHDGAYILPGFPDLEA
jgi:hypothetical protein